MKSYIKHPHATGHPWAITDLCAAYNWPKGTAPGGGVIGIGELGGGWLQSDVAQFCASAGLPAPSITDIVVSGSGNSRCNPQDGADGEVALDIQISAASYSIATGKPATIRVYWADDGDPDGMRKATEMAAKDGCDVFSWSWGADEAEWQNNTGQAFETAATLATTQKGMTIFAASGDNDSSDGGKGAANVDLPASAPHVIGCGGTKLLQVGPETVWNENPGHTDGEGTGGGFSTLFLPQPWQAGAPHGPGRMVPDIAANADPETGYLIYLYGQEGPVGGTSAVAPLYAGLFASFGKKLGFVTPKLWANQLCFNLITVGDNGQYRASDSPSPCTGLGSPIGTSLLALMTTTRKFP